VKFYTFNIAKQQHIILSRTVQSKDCIAVSRMRFVHTPLRWPGPRSYLLYSSTSMHSRGKTLVFPWLRQSLVLQLSCPTNFCKETYYLLMKLSKKFKKLWMLLLFPCPGTIPVPSCWPSCQTSCCVPPSSGCVVGSVVPPLHCPYAVLLQGPRSFTIRAGSQDEIVSISHLKACTEADTTPGNPQPIAGQAPRCPATTKRVSFADPLVSPPSSQAPPGDGPGTIFLPGEEVFACTGPAEPSQPPQTRFPSHQRVPPQRLDL
jgi:hypothetical protein